MYKTSVTNLDKGDVFAHRDEEPFIDLVDGLDTLTEDEKLYIDWHTVISAKVIGSLVEIEWESGAGDGSTWKERIADWVDVVVWEEGD